MVVNRCSVMAMSVDGSLFLFLFCRLSGLPDSCVSSFRLVTLILFLLSFSFFATCLTMATTSTADGLQTMDTVVPFALDPLLAKRFTERVCFLQCMY